METGKILNLFKTKSGLLKTKSVFSKSGNCLDLNPVGFRVLAELKEENPK